MQVKKRLDFSRLSNPTNTLYEAAAKTSQKMSIKTDSASSVYGQEQPKTQRYTMKQRFDQPKTFDMAPQHETVDSSVATTKQSNLSQ